jgi:quercetin dioxygenase-like cupin family protein
MPKSREGLVIMSNSLEAVRTYRIHNPGEGRTVVIDGVSFTLKVTGDETGGAFAVVELTVPPHFSGPGLHVHQQTSEAIYVAQGALAFTLNDETIVAGHGSFLLVTPGTAHRFWNPTAAPATFVAYLSPAGPENYYLDLAALTASSSWPVDGQDKLAAVSQQYDLVPCDRHP